MLKNHGIKKKMENNERKLLRLRDVFIIVTVIAAAFAFYALMPENGVTAVVYLNGEAVAELPLDASGEYSFPKAPDMIFTVADGSVSVKESGCGDKICVRTGKISHKGEAIICVPNRVVVQIEGDAAKGGVDAVL